MDYINELSNMLDKTSKDARMRRSKEDFGEILERYMKDKGYSSAILGHIDGMSDRTIRRMKGEDKYEPTREMIIAACVGMKLSYDEAMYLMDRSAYRLRYDSPIDSVYLRILEYEGEYSVAEWNKALTALGMKELGGGRIQARPDMGDSAHGHKRKEIPER